MKVTKIEYPTPLSMCKDNEDDNIDVFVTLEDGFTYVVVVTTPKNLYWQMDNEDRDHISGHPMIVVRKLTEDNIRVALEALAADYDGYWLKLYALADRMGIEDLNRLKDELIEEQRLICSEEEE
jgi:hypothetical protein